LRNRTGFIIAHRLVTVMKADRVVVLDEGRIVESGPPRQLLAYRGSRFGALAQAQLISGPDADAPAVGRHTRGPGRDEGPSPPGMAYRLPQ
jgi:ATP-binding cassette subfamily B protein